MGAGSGLLAALLSWACTLGEGGFGAPEPVFDVVDAASNTGEDARSSEQDATLDAGKDSAVADAAKAPDANTNDDRCRQTCSRGTCEAGTCVIECSTLKPCDQNACPADVPCKLNCRGASACDTIACVNCDIRCEGAQACKNAFSCARPGCTIRCCGEQACTGNVSCRGAGCSVVCDPSRSSEDPGCSNAPSCDNGLNSCDAGKKC
ncbi:hypothetical protein LVJ94_07025 [Pendulispora rubella]|uniref:Tryptophan synthase alpha chain n=1 Tax=Pendulispora rubella TaxID=2741070 RepID=A0ABZ2L7S0_9BACT